MDLTLLIVRVVVGLGFVAHGGQKLFGAFGGYGLAGTGGYFELVGWKPGKMFAFAAGAAELVGGVLIALGLLGPIGPMLAIATMIVAIAVHAPAGFFGQNGGFELPLAYIGLFLLFAFGGYGAYALDAAFGLATVFTPTMDAAVVGLGILGGLANIAIRRKPAPAPSTT